MELSEQNSHDIHSSTPTDTEESNSHTEHDRSSRASPQPSEALNNLDKIRDILFGQQASKQAQQLKALDQKLTQECNTLRSDFYQRFQTLENRLSDRITQLTQTLETEVADKNKAVEHLHHKLDSTTQTFEQTTSSLSEKATEITQDLQAEIKHQVLTLKDSLEEQIYELISQIEEETRARKDSTVSQKHQLSTLLRNLSEQLQPEPATPEDT